MTKSPMGSRAAMLNMEMVKTSLKDDGAAEKGMK